MIPKFRAWDKVDKEKYFADEINFNCGEFESIGNGITFLRGAEKLNLCFPQILKTKPEKKSLKGIFFKLITLKPLYVLGNTATMTMLVRMFLTGNGFYLECLNVMDPDCISPYETDILDKTEIIGNIYENPEYDQNFVGFRIKGE